jgi:hypothetical protein
MARWVSVVGPIGSGGHRQLNDLKSFSQGIFGKT